ncbi:MAG: type II toxin-antitoxin system Phd/YefM family antitoxin [Eubacteriales bacterium]
MLINTNNLVAMTEANQNFSKVIRLVDDNGMAVILKNNKPRYVLVDFDEYDEIQELRAKRAKNISDTANFLIDENLEAFEELAK